MIHNSGPDRGRLLELLSVLYGREAAPEVCQGLLDRLERYHELLPAPVVPEAGLALSERDAILITYGDQITRRDPAPAETPLATLAGFCERRLAGVISGIHLLPFFPYTSDDGFSVVDYRAVDPKLGGWPDVIRLGRQFRLMFDAVVNHVSASSTWFRGFLADDPRYREFFIAVAADPDLSQVVRPRALPLLTEVETVKGPRRVWTTFSADQIDLNYHSPEVLVEMVDTLLFYVTQGAELIRLDAIAYAWKEIGTACIHLPQTHALVQLFRAVLDAVAPRVVLITETNVPHADNVSYFGDGRNEAQLVYNFALPPLLLHTLHTGSARALNSWARVLWLPSDRTAFFNFTASHDGIGLNPARGILASAEIEAVVERVRAAGGLVSYKNNPDGSQTPYELNINYLDALSVPGEEAAVAVDRFLVSQAIMLALAGVPGIYCHSLFGSRGWPEGVALTRRNRSINRQKLDYDELERELAKTGHRRQVIFERYRQMLLARATTAAFRPQAAQTVLECGDSIFALARHAEQADEIAICVHNVTGLEQLVRLPLAPGAASQWTSLVDGGTYCVDNSGSLAIQLRSYAFEWLIPQGAGEHVDAGSN